MTMRARGQGTGLRKQLDDGFEYDVAISVAHEELELGQRLCDKLRARQLRVYLYTNKEGRGKTWGHDLSRELRSIYTEKCRTCLILISDTYVERQWTRDELKWIAERWQYDEDCLLPLMIDNVDAPSLPPGIAYVAVEWTTESDVVDMVMARLKATRQQELGGIPWIVQPLEETLPALGAFSLLNVVIGLTLFPFTKGLMFLDTIGTCMAGLAFGPWYGLACGALSNLIAWVFTGLSGPYVHFAVVNSLVGAFWGLIGCYRPEWAQLSSGLRSVLRLAALNMISIVITAVAVDIVNLHVLNALETSSLLEISVHKYVHAACESLGLSNQDVTYSLTVLIYNTPDKLMSALVAILLMEAALPLYAKNRRLFSRLRSHAIERIGPLIGLVITLVMMLALLNQPHKPPYAMALWAPILIMALGHTLSGFPAHPTRILLRRQAARRWSKLHRKLKFLRERRGLHFASRGTLVLLVFAVGYYLVWHLWISDMKPDSIASIKEDLKGAILNLIKAFILGGLVVGFALRSVADNMGYVYLVAGNRKHNGEQLE